MKISVFLVSLLLTAVVAVSSMRVMRQAAGVCTKENFDKGVYVVADPARCHRFYKCASPYDPNPASLYCPLEQFFNPVVSTCVLMGDFCTADPCAVSGTVNYDRDTSCSHYCTCSNGRTSECKCCPDGQKFNSVSGACEVDAQCTGKCVKPTNPVRPCRLSAHSTDNTKYVEEGSVRDCAIGAAFILADCGCTGYSSANVLSGCRDQIYLQFDSNIMDINNRVYISKVGSVVVGSSSVPAGQTGSSAALFNNGRIEIDMFTNGWYGNKFTATFSFYPASSAPASPAGSKEMFVSNGGATEQATFSVWYQRNENEVRAAVGVADVVFGNVALGSWHSVRVEFHNGMLKLSVDGTPLSSSKRSTRNIPATSQPLQIGGARSNNENFLGYMDEFKIFKC